MEQTQLLEREMFSDGENKETKTMAVLQHTSCIKGAWIIKVIFLLIKFFMRVWCVAKDDSEAFSNLTISFRDFLQLCPSSHVMLLMHARER